MLVISVTTKWLWQAFQNNPDLWTPEISSMNSFYSDAISLSEIHNNLNIVKAFTWKIAMDSKYKLIYKG